MRFGGWLIETPGIRRRLKLCGGCRRFLPDSSVCPYPPMHLFLLFCVRPVLSCCPVLSAVLFPLVPCVLSCPGSGWGFGSYRPVADSCLSVSCSFGRGRGGCCPSVCSPQKVFPLYI